MTTSSHVSAASNGLTLTDISAFDNTTKTILQNNATGGRGDSITLTVTSTNNDRVDWSEHESDNIDNQKYLKNTYGSQIGKHIYSFTFSLDPLQNPQNGEVYTFVVNAHAWNYGGGDPRDIYKSITITMVYGNAPVINSVNAYDTSRNQTIQSGEIVPQNDVVSAGASVTPNTASIAYTIKETNERTKASSSFSYTQPFTLSPLSGGSPGDTYQYTLTAIATDSNGSSAPRSTSFQMLSTPSGSCVSQSGQTLIATQVNSNNPHLVMFTNGSGNTCKANSSTIDLISDNSAFNSAEKDSVIYYAEAPHTDDTVLVSDIFNSRIWVVHWTPAKNNIGNPTNIKAALLIQGPANYHLVDMEIDAMNGLTKPGYFWITVQNQGMIYNIPWNIIKNQVNNFINNGSLSTITLTPNSYVFATNVGAINNISGGIIPGTNGIKVITAGGKTLVYVNAVDPQTYQREIRVYNVNGTYFKTLSTGYVDNNNANASYWHPDGLTSSFIPGSTGTSNSNYLFVQGGEIRTIWVIGGIQNGNPQLIGGADIYGVNASDGPDGIEIDPYGQLYIAGETEGILTVDANSIVNAAKMNGANIYKGFGANISTYVDPDSRVNWDDIAPLSGTGANYSSYSPYYYTRGGNVYSDGGYTISTLSNDNSTNANAYFSDYLLMSHVSIGANKFAGGSTGSLYNWEFYDYTSPINRVQKATTISRKYGYDNMHLALCSDTTCLSAPITSDTLDTNTKMSGGVYTYTPQSGTLTIDAKSGSLHANGIILVNGNVTIIPNQSTNKFYANTNDRLAIIAKGNIDIQTSNYLPQDPANSPFLYDFVDIGLIADNNITFDAYPGNLPAFLEPLRFEGMALSYGNVNFYRNIGKLNRFYPAVEIDYDAGVINMMYQYFQNVSTNEEIGQ